MSSVIVATSFKGAATPLLELAPGAAFCCSFQVLGNVASADATNPEMFKQV